LAVPVNSEAVDWSAVKRVLARIGKQILPLMGSAPSGLE
jgi:hypothetical protein